MKIWLYFFSSFIRTVFYVLFLIVVLYLVITHIENSLYYFVKYPNISKNLIILYYVWQLPDICLQFLPFAVLIGGIISHWTLSRSGEISALRSSGMSLWRISFPLSCGALFYVVVHLCIAEFIRPGALKEFYKVKYYHIQHMDDPDPFIKTHWVKSKNGALYFDEYDHTTQTLKNPQYFEFDSSDSKQNIATVKLVARSTISFFDTKKNQWILENPTLTLFTTTQKYENLTVGKFETDVSFAPPKLLKANISSDELNYFQLSKLIDSARQAGVKMTDRLTDLYLKISMPFSSFLFLLFTVPFAMQKERQDASYFSILLCILLTSAYWFGNLALKTFATRGLMPPFFAAWGLNIVFCLIAVFIIVKLDKPA